MDWKPVPEQTPAAVEAFLKGLLSYQDQRNLVDAGTQLLVYQTEGTSFSGPYPNWRRLSLDAITRFTITGRPFSTLLA